jgi:hypothetical protein
VTAKGTDVKVVTDDVTGRIVAVVVGGKRLT